MRNHVLNLGIVILALSSMPSCAMEPADEANGVSEIGLAQNPEPAREPSLDVQASDAKDQSSSSETVRNDVIEGDAAPSAAPCGLNIQPGGVCFTIHNCNHYDIWRQIIKTNGGHSICFYIYAYSTLSYCLGESKVAYMVGC